MNTIENNKLIAEFMGLINQSISLGDGDYLGSYYDENPHLLEYNTNWNSLMQVVEKIESLVNKEGYILYDVIIFPDAVRIEDRNGKQIILINKSKGNFTTKIEAVYNSCVEFIKWYNKEQANRAIQDSINLDECSK